ncbi:hypothetical protein F0U44_02760 [Nocardioides humilatus]|uniref:Uncharacterized protein n=1 Tax=Nocardioides humilatus TaxID=2607660 RepID=A0A5B1LNA6_9ACTN|nr:hypothetical protein [Nocardioides humilatus]KAA1421250.1 hypothetical protein F0U44_02760 [Nocardioides humilatus]
MTDEREPGARLSGRGRLIIVLVGALLVVGVVVTAALMSGEDEDPASFKRLTMAEAQRVHEECGIEATHAPLAHTYDVYEECVDEKSGLTGDELWDIVSPLAELPECDDLWDVSKTWALNEPPGYGQECRDGSGKGQRYRAEVDYCRKDGESYGVLVVGPNDLYIFRDQPRRLGDIHPREGHGLIERARDLCNDF